MRQRVCAQTEGNPQN